MAEAPVIGRSTPQTMRLEDGVFGVRFHETLVHQGVRAERAARRRGTAATRTRGMVSGGGVKPWRQKGTGRARAGSSRSPLWAGGGTVFGPTPRSYTFKMNRKERRAALRSALSLHAQRGSLAILDAAALPSRKTKDAEALLRSWGERSPTLLVLDSSERNAALSFRNLKHVAVLTAESVGVLDIVGAASLLLSEAALKSLSARAGEVAGGAAGDAAQDVAGDAPNDREVE